MKSFKAILASLLGPSYGRRVTPRNFRTICSCQKHQRSFRQQYGALVLGLPLVIGAVGYPMSAMNTFDQFSPRRVMESAAAVFSEERFPLVTPRVKEGFLSTANKIDELTLELARKEYFSTEVPYGSLIYTEARRNQLPPELVAAVVQTESNFRPLLISHKNAQGLMQILPSTGLELHATDLLNPADNVRTGTRYLRHLYNRYNGNQRLALAAYNAGSGNVARFGGVPPFQETQQYLRRVAAHHRTYQERVAAKVAMLAQQRLRLTDCESCPTAP